MIGAEIKTEEPSQGINIPEIIQENKLTLMVALRTVKNVADAVQIHPDITFLASMIHCNALLGMCQATPPHQQREITNDPDEFKKLLRNALEIIKTLSKKQLNPRQKNGLADAKEEFERILASLFEKDETQELPVLNNTNRHATLDTVEIITDSMRAEVKTAAINVVEILEADILTVVDSKHRDTIRSYIKIFGTLAELAMTIENKNSLLTVLKDKTRAMSTIITHFGTPDASKKLRDLKAKLENIHVKLQ